MFKKTAVAIAATALMAVGAPAAFASSALTVSVGGDTSDTDHDFTAETKTAVTFVVTNSDSDEIEMGCVSASAEGVVHGGNTSTNNSNSLHHVASITSTEWDGCIGPSDIPMAVTPDHTAAWELIATHNGNVTGGGTDVIDGQITGILASVKDTLTNGGLCSFDVTGSVDASFNEVTQQLVVNGDTLEVDNVSNCFGAFEDGDPVHFDTAFDFVIEAPSSGPVLVS